MLTWETNLRWRQMQDVVINAQGLKWQLPDLLIGVADCAKMDIRFVEKVPSGFSRFMTSFGEVICGEGNVAGFTTNVNNFTHPIWQVYTAMGEQEEDDMQNLDTLVNDLFQPPMVGLEPQEAGDKEVWKDFERTIQCVNQRYKVALPWKPEVLLFLESNYMNAFKRFQSTLKKLREVPEKMKRYHANIMNLAATDIIEEVPDPSITQGVLHYLPHQVIVNPNKPTKIRIVYDGSARPRRGALSINDCLFRGPVLLPHIAGVLLRCRFYPYIMACDIEKAFLQIEIREEDRDSNRFIWTKDPSDQSLDERPTTYRFKRVTFALISS